MTRVRRTVLSARIATAAQTTTLTDGEWPTGPLNTTYDADAPATVGCVIAETNRKGHEVGTWIALDGALETTEPVITPWGSWLTGEKSVARTGQPWVTGSGELGTYGRDHGYVFEILDARAERQRAAPIRAFGRFAHSGIVAGPDRRQVYLSETPRTGTGLFYRWTVPGGTLLGQGIGGILSPRAGSLETLTVIDHDGSVLFDLAQLNGDHVGRALHCEWTPIADRQARTAPTRRQATPGTDATSTGWECVVTPTADSTEVVQLVSSTARGRRRLLYSFADDTLTLLDLDPPSDRELEPVVRQELEPA